MLSRLYFGPSSCHNSHQGELTNSIAHIFTQQKWDNLPLASRHSGEQTTTAQRERRRSEQPPPTAAGDCAAEIHDSPSGRTDHTLSLASQHEPTEARLRRGERQPSPAAQISERKTAAFLVRKRCGRVLVPHRLWRVDGLFPPESGPHLKFLLGARSDHARKWGVCRGGLGAWQGGKTKPVRLRLGSFPRRLSGFCSADP